MSSSFRYNNLYINANGLPVRGSQLCIVEISMFEMVLSSLDSNTVGAARISSLIQELLGSFRVVRVGLPDLFRPLFKWGIVPEPLAKSRGSDN